MTEPLIPHDSVDAFIAQRLPDWVARADADHLQALHRSLQRQQRAQQQLQECLGTLTPLEQFAEDALSDALTASTGQVQDVRATQLVRTVTQLVAPISPSLPLRYSTHASRQSLLAAALHNFEASEALPGGLNAQATLEDAGGTVLALKAEAFVLLCRNLDIGEQYQAYLRTRLGRLIPGLAERDTEQAAQPELLRESIAASMEVAVRLARVRGAIDETTYLRLLPWVSPQPTVAAVADVLEPRQVLLLGKVVQGMAAFAVYADATRTGLAEVIAWIPGDPQGEVVQAADWDALYAILGQRLREPSYVTFFQRFIGQHQQGAFAAALAQGPSASLDGRDLPISDELFDYLARLQVAKQLEDAQVLATPTRLVDKVARDARLQGYLEAGLDLLGLASLFLPGLNTVMLGIAALQVTDELFEGYASWRLGDREAALEHVFAVAGLVAGGVLVGAGAALAGQTLRRVALVDDLGLLRGAGGQMRLAAREPADYRLATATAAGQLKQVGVDWQLALPDGTYALTRLTPSHAWRIRHPQRPQQALLRLEHNGRGGWRHALERPEQWQDARQLLARLDNELAGLTEHEARVILDSTGLDEARLRRLHLDNARAPARLLDALEYHRLRTASEPLAADEIVRRLVGEDASLSPAARVVRRDFPGLSRRACEEVVARGNGQALRKLLDQQRVPLAMAEQARWQLRDSRVDRACAELRQAGRLTRDGEHLAMALADDLAPLADDVRLELRQEAFEGALLVGVGKAEAGQVRTIVAKAAGYQAVDAKGAGLPKASEQASLAEALWLHLDSQQRASIRPGASSAADLSARWPEQAAARRDEVAGWIGLAPLTGVRPPVHLGDGRLGYALGGRGHSSRQALLQALHQVFPSLEQAQLQDYLGERLRAGDNLWSHVADLHRQLEQLQDQLASWQQRASDLDQRNARARAADSVLRAWRRQATSAQAAERLLIEGERIGSLPELPAGLAFTHVRHLALHNLELDTLDDAWLRRFSGVRRLDLAGNRLTALPAALGSLSELVELDLSDNRIVLDDAGNAVLDGLRALESLKLNRNPLGVTPDLPSLSRLRQVHLRDTGLTAVPAVVMRQGGLEFADLRNNRIVDLAESLFTLPARMREHIALHDNPLSAQSQARLQAQAAHGQASLRQILRHLVGDLEARDAWTAGLDEQTRTLRREQWNNLAQEPGGNDLLRLLSDLRGSADYRDRKADLQRRVWAVVEACEQDSQLRQTLFELAAHPRSCSDSVALNFSHLEVRVLVHQSAAGRGEGEVQEALVALGRGLFRLDEVDRAAALEIQARRASGVFVDEVEVRLAYRSGLAQALALPGQPTGMRYSSFANVSQVQLNRVRGQVLTAERAPRLAQSLVERDFWQEHLLSQHAQRFAQIDAPFFERMEAFDALREELSDSEYLAVVNQLGVERETARQELLEQLTHEALRRVARQEPAAQAASATAEATASTSPPTTPAHP
jgi:hypothetical protein